MLLVGCNQRTYDFANGLLSRLRSGYNIVGYVDDVPRIDNSYPLDSCLKYLGTLREFDAIVNNLQVDEVAVTLPIRSCYEDIRQIIELCELRGL
ncbi:MAG: hypothetical protein OEU26_07870, partial [Candidatus Tectomicrobia bacterium]|nr:hypothetical protein [Candidatus Tectomicrobia bacterium]